MQITAPKFRYPNIATDDLWNDEKQARHPNCIKVGAVKVCSTEKKPVCSSVDDPAVLLRVLESAVGEDDRAHIIERGTPRIPGPHGVGVTESVAAMRVLSLKS